MSDSSDAPHPVAAAMQWVARITTVAIEMVLPGLAGNWLDERFQTSFLALVGFALGVTVGIWHLVVMTSSPGTGRTREEGSGEEESDS